MAELYDNTSVHDQLVGYQTNQFQDEPQTPIKIQGSPVGNTIEQEPEFVRRPLFNPTMSVVNESVAEEAREAGWGSSRYDRGEFNPGENLEDRRARSQSDFWKVANGAIKGAITAGTTAVNTVAGLIDGVLEGTYEIGREIVTGEQLKPMSVIDAGVNNFVANKMLDIQNLSEQWFPNYRTEQEQSDKYQDEWYKHIFTSNFIGDSFLKNFGFTIGAMGGGAVWTKALSAKMIKRLPNDLMKGVVASAEGDSEAAAKLMDTLNAINRNAASTIDADVLARNITDAAKAINKMQAKLQLEGSVIAAMGEGLVEGNMARNEFMDGFNASNTQRFIDLNNNLEQEVLAESDKYRRAYMGDDGEIHYELNDAGLRRLQERQGELAAEYDDINAFAKKQADRLASTTFMLNLPILTLSNTIQFGRMFAGGWKTSRNAVGRVGGKISFAENGAPVAAFRGRGNAVLGGVTNSLKVAGSEAAEEMLQGYASSGAKYVADTRISSYTDDGYDRGIMRSFGDWLHGIDEGGWEYLSDTKNWQEGFMGAITGLMGIPGRHWSGGVPEAIRSAREKVNASRQSAEELNNRINSPEFRNMWLGYTRHQKYDRELLDAAAKDDEYAWHGADDKMLINDVIMFADAGRLNDLYEIADRFSNMSQQEADALGVTDMLKTEENENEIANDPQAQTQKVIDKASDIKEVIQQYKDHYDSLRAIMPVGTSEDHIKEMLFTSMQIKRFERRYLEMVNDVLKGLEPVFVRQDEMDKMNDAKQELMSLRESMTRILTGDVFTNLASIVLRDPSKKLLDDLQDTISEDSELHQKLVDMRKLMEDRRAFYDKIVALKNMSSEQFERKAKNDTKVKNEVDREEMTAEVEGFNTINDVKNAVFSQEYGERRDKYLAGLNRVRGEKPVVDEFLKLYSTSLDFADFFMHQNTNFTTSLGGEALNYILNDRLTKLNGLNSEQDFLDLSDDVLPSLDEWIKNREDSGRATQQAVPREQLESSYNEAVNMLRAMLNDYVQLRDKHRASQAARPVKHAPEENPQITRLQQKFAAAHPEIQVAMQAKTPDAPNPGTQVPPPGEDKQKSKIAQDGKSAVDATGRTWNIGETVYAYQADDDGYSDKQEELTIEGFEQKEGDVVLVARDESGKIRKPSLEGQTSYLHKDPAKPRPAIEEVADKPIAASPSDLQKEAVLDGLAKDPIPEEDSTEEGGFIRSGVPEIDSFQAKDAREAIRKKDIAAFAKADLRDIKERNAAFAESWNAVNERGGFRNTVTKVKTGDKLKFVIDSEFPKYEDKIQILVYTERGDFLNTLPFKGTEKLREAILAEYEAQGQPDNFAFSKMSTVWYRPKGLIRYDYSENFAGERSLPDAGYDSERDKGNPIIYFDKDGKAYDARTKRRRALDDDPSLAGRIYYIVRGGDGEQYRIRLGIEHLREDNKSSDNPRIQAIREAANKIEKSFRELLESGAAGPAINAWLKSTSREMHEQLAEIKDKLNIVDLGFEIGHDDNGYYLNVNRTDSEGKTIESISMNLQDVASQDSFYDFLAETNSSLNVSFATINSDLDDLISSGTLTVNADSLMPKGADYWMADWDGNDFKLTDKQREIMEKKTSKQTPAEEIKETGKVEQPAQAPQPAVKPIRPKVIAVKTSETSQAAQPKDDATLESVVRPKTAKFAKDMGLSISAARAALTIAAQGPSVVGKVLQVASVDTADASLMEGCNILYRLFNSVFSDSEKERVEKAFVKAFGVPVTGYNLAMAIDAYSGVDYPQFKTQNELLTSAFNRMQFIAEVNKLPLDTLSDVLRRASDELGIYDSKLATKDIGSNSLNFDTLHPDIQKDILSNPVIKTKEAYDALDDDQKADVILKCLGV